MMIVGRHVDYSGDTIVEFSDGMMVAIFPFRQIAYVRLPVTPKTPKPEPIVAIPPAFNYLSLNAA